jgi:hypothetical protein
MQLTPKSLLSVGAIAVVLVVVYVLSSGSEESVIQKRLLSLVEIVEKDGPVSQFEALGRSRKFKERFAERALIEYLPSRSLPQSADAMQSGFLSVWGQIESAKVTITKHEVELDASSEEAISTFYARARVMMNGSDQMGQTVQYRAFWVKQEGDWLIERIIAESAD